MIDNLPIYIPVVFGLTTALTLLMFYMSIRNSTVEKVRKKAGIVLLCLLGWLLVQTNFTWQGVYYKNTSSIPPAIVKFGVLPCIVAIILLFITAKGRRFIDGLSLTTLTCLHIIRIPVELVLYWLFVYKAVPQLMTFEGRNFDILSGLTAPLVAYFGLVKGKLSRGAILVWNFVCLALLFNIVIHAILSAPWPFQQLAFDQPNIGILYFPFSWLPVFIVPVVLFSHLVSIRRLMHNKQ